jgi:hypothetical protein
MNKPEVMQPDSTLASLARQSIAFVRDFAAFAAREGLWAATLAVVAAAFDGIGLLLLVPILSVVTASEAGTGWAHTVLVPLLDFVGAQTRTARLSVMLCLLAALIVIRAVVIGRRNITLAQLESGFVEAVRARIANRLAAAPWPVVSRLQHARITHLISGDIHRLGGATYT